MEVSPVSEDPQPSSWPGNQQDGDDTTMPAASVEYWDDLPAELCWADMPDTLRRSAIGR